MSFLLRILLFSLSLNEVFVTEREQTRAHELGSVTFCDIDLIGLVSNDVSPSPWKCGTPANCDSNIHHLRYCHSHC
jgi:hypothetical protein